MAKQRTYFAKLSGQKQWFLLDAKGKTLGRIATQIATVLQGKHKPTYTPHIDTGDFVVVINCSEMVCTSTDKTYYWHTGYPGGIRSEGIGERMSRKPDQVLIGAVKRMLPKGPLGRDMLSKLKAFQGDSHRHEAQMPSNIEETEFWEK
jgi:large subunit ribosomal protein L13